MVTDEQLAEFCEAVYAKRMAHYAASGLTVSAGMEAVTVFERGKKNARIVVSNGPSRSAFCFVRLEDGAILKAAGWSAPANGVRGNIANGAADVTEYGAVYRR